MTTTLPDIRNFEREFDSGYPSRNETYEIQDENVKINKTNYAFLNDREKRLLKGKVVEIYLKNRGKCSIEQFSALLSKKKFAGLGKQYEFDAERIRHIVGNLEINLADNYSTAVGKKMKDFDGRDRERAYGFLERKIESARNSEDPESVLNYETLKRDFNPSYVEKQMEKKKSGFFSKLGKILNYQIW